MKKIGAFLAAVAVLLGAGVSGSADPAPANGGTPPGSPVVPLSEDFTQVAASGFLRLGVDLCTANLAVWDSRENTVWYANPRSWKGWSSPRRCCGSCSRSSSSPLWTPP